MLKITCIQSTLPVSRPAAIPCCCGSTSSSGSSLKSESVLWWWKQKQHSLCRVLFFLFLFFCCLKDSTQYEHSWVLYKGEGEFRNTSRLSWEGISTVVPDWFTDCSGQCWQLTQLKGLWGTCAAVCPAPVSQTCILGRSPATLFPPDCTLALETWRNHRNVGVFFFSQTANWFFVSHWKSCKTKISDWWITVWFVRTWVTSGTAWIKQFSKWFRCVHPGWGWGTREFLS